MGKSVIFMEVNLLNVWHMATCVCLCESTLVCLGWFVGGWPKVYVFRCTSLEKSRWRLWTGSNGVARSAARCFGTLVIDRSVSLSVSAGISE